MDYSEAFSFLFFDSLMAALIFPIQDNLVFPIMLIFGGYPIFKMFAMATAGATLATWMNMVLGRALRCIPKLQEAAENTDPEHKGKLQRFALFTRKYGYWGLVLCVWIPFFGAVYTVIVAICRVPWKLVTIAAFIGHVLGFYLLTL
jgi:membrane protein YqaA with SNARE-associated domain